jgi:hypothetical protein
MKSWRITVHCFSFRFGETKKSRCTDSHKPSSRQTVDVTSATCTVRATRLSDSSSTKSCNMRHKTCAHAECHKLQRSMLWRPKVSPATSSLPEPTGPQPLAGFHTCQYKVVPVDVLHFQTGMLTTEVFLRMRCACGSLPPSTRCFGAPTRSHA